MSARDSIPSLLADWSETVTKQGSVTYIKLKPNTNITKAIFLRQPMEITGSGEPDSQDFFKWLTVSQTQVVFRNMVVKGKIQITASAEFSAYDCTFTGLAEADAAVEVFSCSKANLVNCRFINNPKSGAVCRDRAYMTIRGCSFLDETQSQVITMDCSASQIFNSFFTGAKRFGVYCYRQSTSLVDGCTFEDLGKGIFSLRKSYVKAVRCTFRNCRAGGASAGEQSVIIMKDSSWTNINSTCLHLIKDSQAIIYRCYFENSPANGIHFEYSSGYADSCVFNGLKYPAICVFGPHSNPIIANCSIVNCESSALSCRDCAIPVFMNNYLQGNKVQAISCSDFSRPIIMKNTFRDHNKQTFCVFNGAEPKIALNNIYYEAGTAIETFGLGKPTIYNNYFHSPEGKILISIHNRGLIDFRENYFIENGNYKSLTLNENNMTLVVGETILDIESQIEQNTSNLRNLNESFDLINKAETSPFLVVDENEPPLNDVNDNKIVRSLSTEIPEEPQVVVPQRIVPAFNHNPHYPNPGWKDDEELKFDIAETPISESLEAVPLLTNYLSFIDKVANRVTMPMKIPIQPVSAYMDNLPERVTHNHNKCVHCGNDAEAVAAPCGHEIYCTKCAKEIIAKRNADRTLKPICPLCQTVIAAFAKEYPETTCAICLDNPCDTIILPCGHRCICYECATILWTEKRQCPICCGKIISYRHVFPL